MALANRNPAIRALAYLRGGDQLLAQSTVPLKDSNPDSEDQTVAKGRNVNLSSDLDTAASMYKQVIQDEQVHLIYKLNAQMGLAAIAECRRDWAQAHLQYQTVSDLANEKYATLAQRARNRTAMLDRINKPVVFGPDPVTTQPNFPDITGLIDPDSTNDAPSVEEDTDTP